MINLLNVIVSEQRWISQLLTNRPLYLLCSEWTWCVESADDKPTCDSMVERLRALDPEKDEHTHTW